jgi:NAD(P)-dependent dehydrogenase (short-subunit alcohol dehydrogenase family)
MKNVLITGSTGNLGDAVVRKFLKEGCHITGTFHSSAPESFHPDLKYYPVNLSDEKAVSAFFSEVVNKSHLDAALLLAGGYAGGSIEKTLPGDLKKMFSLNFDTAFFAARLAYIQMISRNKGGKIVFVGSRPALNASIGKQRVAYALSKSLLFRLSEIINVSGIENNITAHVIVPDTIDTPENRTAMPKADFSKWQKPEMIADTLFEIFIEKIRKEIIEF